MRAPIVKSSAKPKATNKATPGRSRRVPTNKNNPAQDVATPPSVPIITAASSTCDLRRRYASLNRNRRLSIGPAASNCSASASTRSATRARRVERTLRRDAIPESRKTGVSATWMTCATLSTLSRPSMCHHRAVFVAGLSKPTLLRQLLPSRAFSSKLHEVRKKSCSRQGAYPPQVATLGASLKQDRRGMCSTILFRQPDRNCPPSGPSRAGPAPGGPAMLGRR